MKIEVCKFCGSPAVNQDATYDINREEYYLHDNQMCGSCGMDGNYLTIEVEVDEDFNLMNDTYDLTAN